MRGALPGGPVRCALRVLGSLGFMTLASLALAQQCTSEVEPNDTPAQATLLTGAGPDAVAAASRGRLGIICLTGEVSSGDQDAFLWVVDEEGSTNEWELEVEGPRGGLTQVDVIDVEFADNGVDVTRADGLFRFGTTTGASATSERFLVSPGRYVLGVSGAQAAGRYVVNLRPAPLGDRSSLRREGRAADAAFSVHAPLAGGFTLPFSLDEQAGDYVWGLAFQAPIGTSPTLTIVGPAGDAGVLKATGHGPVRLTNLGLVPGDYVVEVTPGAVEDTGYGVVELERLGSRSNGVEVEPNDRSDAATMFPLGGEMTGVADGADYYRVEVGPDAAGSVWDLQLAAGDEVRLRVYGPDDRLLQERRGVSGTSRGLHLGEGTYFIYVEARHGADYTLSWLPGMAAEEGYEREPNDLVSGATPLGPEMQARGELRLQDVDFFRLDVDGEAQLFRLQVVGEGVEELALYDAGGNRQARSSGERRIRLDDVVLLPGPNFVRVAGAEGEYAFRALSLGPAPEPVPPEDAPAADEPLAAAPEGGQEDQDAESAAADLSDAGLPTLPRPPPGALEREPNDDASRAHRLRPGAVHVGRLSASDDIDHYRFHLATSQYVRLELIPSEGETGWAASLGGSFYYQLPEVNGDRIVAERWLLAGDHEVRLQGSWLRETPSGYYQLRLLPRGTLGLPVDLEPNDSLETAATLPSDLRASGRVGEARDRDYYRLPVFPDETVMDLTAATTEAVSLHLTLGGRAVDLEVAEDGSLTQTLPAGEETYLRVSGKGEYRFELDFSSPVDPAWLRPPPDTGDVSVRLDLERQELAAFWHDGQSIEGTITLENGGGEAVTTALTAAVDVPGASVEMPPTAMLPANGSVEVPVTVRLPADVPDQAPVRLQIAATGPGLGALGDAHLTPRCEAAPVAPFPHWQVPEPLLGRPNVLLAGLGAMTPDGVEAANRDRYVNDGRTTVSGGGWAGSSHSPTYRLAVDEAVELVGTVLNPAADVGPKRQLRRFRIETSLDGTDFEKVLEGELTASRIDQAFLFEQPVRARYVRLVGVDSYDGDDGGYFGEWKVVADDPALFSGLDLASPELGGHVVWSEPHLSTGDRRDLLAGDAAASYVDLAAFDTYSFAVGFFGSRAALIDSLSLTQPEVKPEQLFTDVQVEVSLEGAAGPWRHLVSASLGEAGQVTEVALDSPVWARYLRFTFPKADGGRFYYSPREVAVNEAPVADGYLSVLSEWGTDTTAGPREYLLGHEAIGKAGEGDAGDTAADAAPLASGDVVTGSVAVAEDVDWYRITVPEGENHLEVKLSGDPTIAYAYELTDEAGDSMAVQATEEGDELVLSAFVEPGDYLLRLEEPKRTVIFAWDTSGSVSPYQAITYSSLASFAQDVDASREAVQLLAFDDPAPQWLLPYWSSDTERVQRAITEWDRDAGSSNSEMALLTATQALEGRDGTKAILFMTDAESGGDALTADLWRALGEVRPRVFTFEISSSGREYPQQLMQTWAGVNSGFYEMATGVADFDAGFARASCLLRRPKRYTVSVTTAAVEPPGPGTLSVLPSEDASGGAVHVIFDASGSMGQALPSGEQRIVAAKRALEDLVGAALDEGTPFSLRAFGHVAPNSCETSLDVELGPLNREAAMAAVSAIEPKLLSQTAIADSLGLAVEDLSDAAGPRTVILITDGEESCGGDPAAAAAELRAAGDTAIAIVSLALDDEGLAVFEALAEDIGATYVDVGSFEDLQAAITQALVPAFEVYDAGGGLVATGRVGDSVELPMGVYSVRVLTAPVEVFDSVTVPGDGNVRVVAGSR